MGFVGLFVIAVKLLDILAWPLLALGYPLYASIVAIETNSSEDAQKLVTYWVLFSLISLVEHALGTLLLWLPFWSYIKLAFIIWLMIPHFDGAFYVYEHFIRPCLSISSRVITNGLNKQKELSLNGEDFLVEAEKYLNENGPEVFEKLLSSQSMCKKPMVAPKHVIAAEVIEKKEVTAVQESRYGENTAACHKDKGVDELEEGKVNKAGPNVTESGIRFGMVDDKEIPKRVPKSAVKESRYGENAAACHKDKGVDELEEGKVNKAGPNVTESGIRFGTVDDKEIPKRVPKSESGQPPQESQREWTCALCQVKAHSEDVLKSHLQGKKHKAAVTALKAKKQSLLSKDARKVKKPDQPKGDSDNSVNADGNRWKNARMLEKVKREVSETGRLWCSICNVTCTHIGNFVEHCSGKKHMARIEELSSPNVGRQEDEEFKNKAVGISDGKKLSGGNQVHTNGWE